jgi:hypothetical protein
VKCAVAAQFHTLQTVETGGVLLHRQARQDPTECLTRNGRGVKPPLPHDKAPRFQFCQVPHQGGAGYSGGASELAERAGLYL